MTNLPHTPYAINLYVLGYDNNGNLNILNNIIKENLATYLENYRILTQGINIMDAYIVNIGIQFDLVANKKFNAELILFKCLSFLKDYFDIKK